MDFKKLQKLRAANAKDMKKRETLESRVDTRTKKMTEIENEVIHAVMKVEDLTIEQVVELIEVSRRGEKVMLPAATDSMAESPDMPDDTIEPPSSYAHASTKADPDERYDLEDLTDDDEA